MKLKKIRIKSDTGIGYQCSVTDEETGEPIPGAYAFSAKGSVYGIVEADVQCHPAGVDMACYAGWANAVLPRPSWKMTFWQRVGYFIARNTYPVSPTLRNKLTELQQRLVKK